MKYWGSSVERLKRGRGVWKSAFDDTPSGRPSVVSCNEVKKQIVKDIREYRTSNQH